MKKTDWISTAAILGCMVVMVLIGALGYRSILESREKNRDLRLSLSFLRTQVKEHDCLMEINGESTSAVEILQDGQILVLKETDGMNVYETRIYLYDGYLVEEYVKEGAGMNGDTAMKICRESLFDVRQEGNLLHVTLSQGETDICLFAGRRVRE